MNVGERIKRRRKQLKLTADELAEKLGKNRATIYRYEKNEIENMPYEVIVPLAEVLRVSPAYLMGWEENNNKIISTPYKFIPTAISAGLPLDVESIKQVEEIEIPDALMGKWAGSDVFITRINGESMNKVMPHDSLIAVKPTDLCNLKDGDMVVFSDHHEYSVKRFYRDEEKIIFRPYSSDRRFTDYITNTTNSDLKIYGKVVVYVVGLD
ncbi:helix-turn-helix domain-containing protein [Virgibacillus halodenitrificans]|uniref:helix-turn-helix domain-containing protein n=1 Tax=Virgibacillus halodenitrificans TaxID=1482 RepID=UPI001F303DED|nr:XRE family transcriptional regulator [Virgibacillus halodenitrificans]MCG1029276.1 helix-turn-helix domain-containing protein [Virgibacillus halodenitrificans]